MLDDVKLELHGLSTKQEALLRDIDPRQESKLLDFHVRLVTRVLDAERCSIFILDPDSRKVWLKTGTGISEGEIVVSMKGSIVGDVIESGKAVIAGDLMTRQGTHRMIDSTTGFVTRDIVCVPIRSVDRRRITGAIEALNKRDGSGFTHEDQAFLEEVAEQFQQTVESVYLSQEAVNMSRKMVAVADRAMLGNFVVSVVCIVLLVILLSALLHR